MPVTGVGWQLGGCFTNYEIMFDISKSIALELGGGGGHMLLVHRCTYIYIYIHVCVALFVSNLMIQQYKSSHLTQSL